MGNDWLLHRNELAFLLTTQQDGESLVKFLRVDQLGFKQYEHLPHSFSIMWLGDAGHISFSLAGNAATALHFPEVPKLEGLLKRTNWSIRSCNMNITDNISRKRSKLEGELESYASVMNLKRMFQKLSIPNLISLAPVARPFLFQSEVMALLMSWSIYGTSPLASNRVIHNLTPTEW